MRANAILDECIEPGRCFALVTTRRRLLESQGIRERADFVVVIGNVFAQEKLTVPVNLAYLIGMLRLARPLRITIDAGQHEDAEAIRALLPPDRDQGPEFEQVADAAIESSAVMARMKGCLK